MSNNETDNIIEFNESNGLALLNDPAIHVIDCTKISCYARCPRKFFYQYVLGWIPETKSHHLIFGIAWHKLMAEILNQGYTPEAVDAGMERFQETYRKYFDEVSDTMREPKTPARARMAALDYIAQYRNDNFKCPFGTEICGSIDLSPRLDNDAPFELHYQIDAIVEAPSGNKYILEHKTASRVDSTWGDVKALSFQVGLYSAVASMNLGTTLKGCIVNASVFRKNDHEHMRVPVSIDPQWLEIWLWNITDWCKSIQVDFESLIESQDSKILEAFPLNPEACADFAQPCQYIQFCKAWQNPINRPDPLRPPEGFIREIWDPSKPKD